MRRRALWRVSIVTRPEAEEAVAELLERVFATTAVSDYNLEAGRTTVSAYLSQKPDWSAATRKGLAAGLAHIEACGLASGPGRMTLGRVRREDWANSWKKHFQPIEVGRALLVRPSWSRRRARRGQAVVVLDPGLSFGTGQHPTTAFCLEQLAVRKMAGEAQSFLDMGMGSGILGIAAAKLGYQPVCGFDFDPEAVRIARLNARRNRVEARVRFVQQDVVKLPRRSKEKYAVVCANLISNLLVSERQRILARLRGDGVLVLAGILKTEFSEVQRAYEKAGCRLVKGRTEREWRSGAFVWDE
jgi:ribosomal protein L11 methyltransferase